MLHTQIKITRHRHSNLYLNQINFLKINKFKDNSNLICQTISSFNKLRCNIFSANSNLHIRCSKINPRINNNSFINLISNFPNKLNSNLPLRCRCINQILRFNSKSHLRIINLKNNRLMWHNHSNKFCRTISLKPNSYLNRCLNLLLLWCSR